MWHIRVTYTLNDLYLDRKSQELRHSKEQESEDWFKKYQLRSQAMRRNVGLHAKSLDSNHGLKKGFKEKLRKHM